MTDTPVVTARRKEDLVKKDGLIKRTLHLIFGWKTITYPWRKISTFARFWWKGTEDRKYRALAAPTALLILTALVVGPLLTSYPGVWVATYPYNYTSVIYPDEIPNIMPKETQQELAAYDENKGTAVVGTLIKIGDEMLTNWQDNDLWLSSSKSGVFGTDNPRHFQRGELQMYRFVLQEMRGNFTRNGTNDAFNPLIVNAYNSIAFRSDSWIFPRTEGVYGDGVDALRTFYTDIKAGRASIYPTTYNAAEMIKTMASALAGTARVLETVEKTKISIPLFSSQTEPVVTAYSVGKSKVAPVVPWNQMDDIYYEGQGSLRVALQVLKAVRVDARKAIAPKGADELFSRVIQRIEENTAYLKDPIIVVNETWFSPSNCSPLALALQSASKDMEKLALQMNN